MSQGFPANLLWRDQIIAVVNVAFEASPFSLCHFMVNGYPSLVLSELFDAPAPIFPSILLRAKYPKPQLLQLLMRARMGGTQTWHKMIYGCPYSS
jgi:hypothetical protein